MKSAKAHYATLTVKVHVTYYSNTGLKDAISQIACMEGLHGPSYISDIRSVTNSTPTTKRNNKLC